MDYTSVMARIADRIMSARSEGKLPGPHSWVRAVSVRLSFLLQVEKELQFYMGQKIALESKGPGVLKIGVKVERVSDMLDQSDKLWMQATNNYTPNIYTDGMTEMQGVTSGNNLVKRLQKNKAPQESDPHGKDAHEPGAKLDDDKLRAGLVLGDFSLALEKVVEVGTYGAKKYTDHGWLSVPDGAERYHDAFHRHLLKHDQGESIDPESELSHWAHLAWNALAILELWSREKDKKV